MGARLRVFLTREQDKTLLNLRTADIPQKVKDLATVIRLNAHGWYVEKIAAHFNWTPQTVREVLHKWQKIGLQGQCELPGRGGKTKWKEEDIVFLSECLKKEPRTYNSLQLAEKLESERQIKLSPDRLRRVLKKRGSNGYEHAQSHKGKQDPVIREIKLFSPRYAGISCCCRRNRPKVFGGIRVRCMERAWLHLLPTRRAKAS